MPAPGRRRGQAAAGIQSPGTLLLDSRSCNQVRDKLCGNDTKPQERAVYVCNGPLVREASIIGDNTAMIIVSDA